MKEDFKEHGFIGLFFKPRVVPGVRFYRVQIKIDLAISVDKIQKFELSHVLTEYSPELGHGWPKFLSTEQFLSNMFSISCHIKSFQINRVNYYM